MSQKRNSASRLLTLLNNIPWPADNAQTLILWADLFKVQDSNPNKLSLLVAERLATVNRELNLIRSGMTNTSFSAELYTSALDSFEAALSPMLLPHACNNVKQYITAQNLQALGFCSEILPNEESEISQTELDEIHQLVDELQALLIESSLPERLQAILAHHIQLILQALAEYPIAGAKALREAANTGLGELVEAKDIVVEHQDSQEISKLGETWKKFNNASDAAFKVHKALELAHKGWEFIQGIIS